MFCTAVNRLKTRNTASCFFKIRLRQELSYEVSITWHLLAGLVTHAAANWPEKSTRAQRPTRDAPRCMSPFAATVSTRHPINLHNSPPPPSPLGTHIAALETVANRNGCTHLPSARQKRSSCQRSCHHQCSAGTKLCGIRRRARGEVREGEKCPPRHETRRPLCALRAQIGDCDGPAHEKNDSEWSSFEWVIKRYSD